MKIIRKWAALVLAVLTVAAGSVTAFAAESPAEIVAGLTGQSVEAVIAERTESGKTYGALAAVSGKLEEFRIRMLEQKKSRIEERVEAGTMTEARAEAVLAAMETRRADCNGTGTGNMYGGANGNGACDGTGDGICDSTGTGNMYGGASANGSGNGACDGTRTGNMYGGASANGSGNGACDGTGTGVCDGTGAGNASGAARGNRAFGAGN